MKVYFFSSSNIVEDWSQEIYKLEQINPDKIVIVSNSEVYIEGNWGKLFSILNPWLQKNNKIATIITPHLDNKFLMSNIVAEQSYAMIESVVPLYKDKKYENLFFNKVYCSYMYRPSESRGRLIDCLVEENLLKNGHVTYHNTSVKTHDAFRYFRKPAIIFQEESYSKNTLDHFTDPFLYRQSFIDIVAEASYETDNFFMTEKTIRPICHEKPFITIGSPGFHTKYLKDFFGLELYDEIIDYSFDQELDLQKRIDGIIDNLKNLINNNQRLNESFKLIHPKLKFNRQRLFEIYNNRDMIIPKCLQFMIDTKNTYEVYGSIPSIFYLIETFRKRYG